MKQILIQFLSNFSELTQTQVNEMADLMKVATFKKNSSIVKEGDYCTSCYFVLKGCLRQYIIQDGIEKTIAIYTENQSINYFISEDIQTKAENNLICIEDSTILVGNPKSDAQLFSKFPMLVDITRRMIEADLNTAQKNISTLITSSPEQRYKHLLEERPDLIQRVPQHIIASFLGITPESLSRIRKRIATVNK